MKIQLKNIGMLKEANIKLDGLTVIAGENDTGKSTVGKALFASIKADNIAFKQKMNMQQSKEALASRLNLIFDANISEDGTIQLIHRNKIIFDAHIRNKNFISQLKREPDNNKFFDATLVQSPIIFDMVDFFNSVARMRERRKFDYSLDFDISYPYLMWDLYDKLSKKNPFPKVQMLNKIHDAIQNITDGEFKEEHENFLFYKYLKGKVLTIEMSNTAFGIKSFGILQLLNQNGFLNNKILLILDEPEVHLHPKWQLKMAELIVLLVQSGVKILVNSHSPYMIEALQRYSEREKVTADFYLAEDGYINKIHDSNSQTLEKIFEKLSEPFDVFDEMDSVKLQNG